MEMLQKSNEKNIIIKGDRYRELIFHLPAFLRVVEAAAVV